MLGYYYNVVLLFQTLGDFNNFLTVFQTYEILSKFYQNIIFYINSKYICKKVVKTYLSKFNNNDFASD